jgi:prepilin-type N-terminal cleavage/methylation domain-containing protein
MKSFLSTSGRKAQRGFTLLELMIVLGIFAIFTGLLVANYHKFGSNLDVTNLAYSVALSVREAQLYGVSVKESAPGSDQFTNRYGIHFTHSSDPATNNTYQIFYDSNNNGQWDASDQQITVFTVTNGNSIESICGIKPNGGGSDDCNGTLDITFLRPNPEARISTNAGAQNYQYATICLVGSSGRRKYVEVDPTGQVSVVDPVDSHGNLTNTCPS